MLTPSQTEFCQSLKKYRNFPAKDRDKFPLLAHLKNPAARYKFFCEAHNKGEKVIEYKEWKKGETTEESMPMLSAVGLINQAIAS